MDEEDLKAMNLHEEIQIDEHVFVRRVVNGWIYIFILGDSISSQMVYETLPIIQHIEPRK